MGNEGLISIITPTYGRPAFLERLKSYVLSQTYADFEWLILDDSRERNPDFVSAPDRRIRYVHSSTRSTIGAKRNALVDMARGHYIVQFDDDDYYKPNYLAWMVHVFSTAGPDIVNLSGWFLLDLRWNFFGYWDLQKKDGLHYCCDRSSVSTLTFDAQHRDQFRDNEFGYGFTYAFRRRVWEICKFPDIDLGEDSHFFTDAMKQFKAISVQDRNAMCLHILHRGSTSRCFPQFRFPGFLFGKLFPESVARV